MLNPVYFVRLPNNDWWCSAGKKSNLQAVSDQVLHGDPSPVLSPGDQRISSQSQSDLSVLPSMPCYNPQFEYNIDLFVYTSRFRYYTIVFVIHFLRISTRPGFRTWHRSNAESGGKDMIKKIVVFAAATFAAIFLIDWSPEFFRISQSCVCLPGQLVGNVVGCHCWPDRPFDFTPRVLWHPSLREDRPALRKSGD